MDARYERNFQSLSLDDQEILNNSKVAIVGLGGLGGYILENLVRIGVKNFHLIDMDVFDRSNLNRQILSHENNIGLSKVEEAAKRAYLIDKNINLKKFHQRLYSNSFLLLDGVDIVIDGLDSPQGKVDLEKLCQQMDLPLVYGAIAGYYGNAAFSSQENRLVGKIYRDVDNYENKLGNLPMTCMVTASLQANIAINFLLNRDPSNELIYVDVRNMTMDKFKIE